MNRMRKDMERAQRELEVAQETIRRLEQQLSELHETKRILEKKEHELRGLTQQLQSQLQMSEEERAKLIEEIQHREAQVTQMRDAVELKTVETNELQREVEEYRERQNIHSNVINVALAASSNVSSNYSYHHSSSNHHFIGNSHDDLVDAHVELMVNDDINCLQTELDRVTHTDQNVNKQQKLEELPAELDQARNQDGLSDYDVLHMESRRAGRDKNKTLPKIKGGNTKHLIDQFENYYA